MTWFGWFIIIVEALGVLLAIKEVGKPRKPRTTGDVALQFVAAAALAFLVLTVGTGHLS